ncbi:MAG: DeoR/GlpR transcriptional regulator, partial [Acidaminococcaceae bacterium]|nr:DeoR/GlpR transcriptional regulator [Acidaminococcaceae bacterium]
QEIVLNNAREKYIVADSSKIDKEDFYKFYNLDEITALITDEKITDKEKKDIEKYTRIIC